jgi:hypothetical protein
MSSSKPARLCAFLLVAMTTAGLVCSRQDRYPRVFLRDSDWDGVRQLKAELEANWDTAARFGIPIPEALFELKPHELLRRALPELHLLYPVSRHWRPAGGIAVTASGAHVLSYTNVPRAIFERRAPRRIWDVRTASEVAVVLAVSFKEAWVAFASPEEDTPPGFEWGGPLPPRLAGHEPSDSLAFFETLLAAPAPLRFPPLNSARLRRMLVYRQP